MPSIPVWLPSAVDGRAGAEKLNQRIGGGTKRLETLAEDVEQLAEQLPRSHGLSGADRRAPEAAAIGMDTPVFRSDMSRSVPSRLAGQRSERAERIDHPVELAADVGRAEQAVVTDLRPQVGDAGIEQGMGETVRGLGDLALVDVLYVEASCHVEAQTPHCSILKPRDSDVRDQILDEFPAVQVEDELR